MAERGRRRRHPGSRRVLAAGAAQMIRLLLLAVVATAVLTAESSASPARVGVGATEFHLTLSRAAIKSGPVIIQLANYGEDDHKRNRQSLAGIAPYVEQRAER